MRKTICLLFILMLGGMITASDAFSQFVWNTIYPDYDGQYYNCFDKLDCKGNNCTAAGVIVDESAQTIRWMFWSSSDGGLTWKNQDPKLAVETRLPSGYFNCLQQIDSLNIIAATYSYKGNQIFSLPIRSFDGGNTWKQQSIGNIPYIIKDIHFSNPLEGILIAQLYEYDTDSTLLIGFGPIRVMVTTDGGNKWDSAAEVNRTNQHCYSYGEGKFALYNFNGPFLTTTNSWKTIDTISHILDSIDAPANYYRFNYCNFTGGDTMIIYGYYFNDGNYYDKSGVLMRTTDGGRHWNHPVLYDSVMTIENMTSLENDTVLAGGPSNGYILLSTDHGATWRTDSLLLDMPYPAYSLKGIALPASGKPIASYAFDNKFEGSIPSILIRGEQLNRRVEWSGRLGYNQRIFPNPATISLNIASIEAASPYKIMDLFGRTVMKGMVLDHATLTVDISELLPGIYFVFVDSPQRRIPIPVGKVMVVGR